MKRKYLFFPLAAAMALASCSNDENPQDEPDAPADDVAYLAVSIIAPSENAGRGDETKFEEGTAAENGVTSAKFILFDANGTQITQVSPASIPMNGPATDTDHSIAKVSDVILVIDGVKNFAGTQMLTVLNYTGTIDTNANLSTVLGLIGTDNAYASTEKDKFVMSSSVYNSPVGKPINAVSVSDHLKKTPEDAKGSPVDVYVERVLAKVVTGANATSGFDIKKTTEPLDGTDAVLTPVIKGIEVANIAKQSYLFKNIEGISFTNWSWNDPTHFRSYWANTPETGMTYANQSWNAIIADYKDTQTFYAQENTIQDVNKPKTAVLVTAEIQKDGAAVTLIRYAGHLYTTNGYLNIIADQLKHKYAIESAAADGATEYTSIPVAALETYGSNDWEIWEAAARVKDPAEGETELKYVDAVTKAEVTREAINAYLSANSLRAWQWTDGKCYYYVNIEHDGLDADGKRLEGVVRNHVYKLSLTSLEGLGVPVFDPEREIIPKRPSDDAFYLAARINVLKWRIVGQEINFN